MLTLGFDTSNYTTSVAAFDGVGGRNCSRLLDVKPGELGLRQSDALFAHVKRLPELVQRALRGCRAERHYGHRRQYAAAGRRRLVYAVLSGRLVAGELPRAASSACRCTSFPTSRGILRRACGRPDGSI